MAAKLYVGGLSYSTTSETLREYFSQCGTVESASVVTDKFSGQSRGFGFVEMATAEEAQRAISELNGKDLDGRKLTVNVSNPRPAGGGGGGRGPAAAVGARAVPVVAAAVAIARPTACRPPRSRSAGKSLRRGVHPRWILKHDGRGVHSPRPSILRSRAPVRAAATPIPSPARSARIPAPRP